MREIYYFMAHFYTQSPLKRMSNWVMWTKVRPHPRSHLSVECTKSNFADKMRAANRRSSMPVNTWTINLDWEKRIKFLLWMHWNLTTCARRDAALLPYIVLPGSFSRAINAMVTRYYRSSYNVVDKHPQAVHYIYKSLYERHLMLPST